MTFIEHMREAVERLAVFGELDVDPAVLPGAAVGLSDRSVRDALTEAAGLARQVALLQSVLAGVAANRSGRDRGHGGVVQESGHRNTVEFIRDVTGATRGEAIRAVKVGESLLDGVVSRDAGGEPDGGDEPDGASGPDGGPGPDARSAAPAWDEPVRAALLSGALTTAQHHAIRAGLGEPPQSDEQDPGAVIDAWRAAAAQLVGEASTCTVEDLGARARTVRDMLDPGGAEDRFAARYKKRSYRSWTDQDGARQARIVFDDEAGHWLQSLFDTALAPRRGGPRFVADDEKVAAHQLTEDPRSNEQLAYDLLVDLLRAGALADAKDVYGAKEPGVRLVALRDATTGETVRRDAFGRLLSTATSEDGQIAVPGSVVEKLLCATGGVEVITDMAGNPLDLGREARTFTGAQRLTLAIRDGGCLWPGCDRPPAMCEAHHIDEWASGGRTDIDRGVLLCRFHHLHLHHGGWRITRDGTAPFQLHPPPRLGAPAIPLRSNSPLRWVWDPPPRRASWRGTAA